MWFSLSSGKFSTWIFFDTMYRMYSIWYREPWFYSCKEDSYIFVPSQFSAYQPYTKTMWYKQINGPLLVSNSVAIIYRVECRRDPRQVKSEAALAKFYFYNSAIMDYWCTLIDIEATLLFLQYTHWSTGTIGAMPWIPYKSKVICTQTDSFGSTEC